MHSPFTAMLKRTDLAAGYPVGTFAMGASPLLAEALGHVGFDWAVVDMEHSPLDMADLVHMLQAVAGTPLLPITRVPWNDTVVVKRVLDAGAQTLMVPFVENVEEARAAASACRYAPQGRRGMAAMSRASRFGTTKDHLKTANQGIALLVQIETPQAMTCIDQIAAVDGVTSIFMGPGDMSGAMGFPGETMHPEVLALMREGVKRCHAAGKPVGTVGGTPEAVATYRAAGFDYIGCASDLGLFMRQCAAVLSTIRAQQIQVDRSGY